MLLKKIVFSNIIQLLNILAHLFFGLLLAYYFGATSVMDNYVVASTFLASLSALLITPQNSAFIPFITSIPSQVERRSAAASVFRFNLVLFIFAGILILFFSKYIASLIAPGFPSSQFESISTILRILCPFLLLSNLGAIGIALLDYQLLFERRYALLLVQSIANIALLVVMVRPLGIYCLPVATVLSGLLLVAALMKYDRLKWWRFRPLRGEFARNVRQYVVLFSPVLVSSGFVWAIRYSEMFLGSMQAAGSLSYLSYCSRIEAYSVVIAGVTLSVYYPILTGMAASGKHELFRMKFNEGLSLIFAINIGIVIYLITFPEQIISLLFQRGKFLAKDTETLSRLVRFYSFVLIGGPLGAYFANAYYSFRKTKQATLCSIISSSINILLNIVLGIRFGIFGLAAAASVSVLVGNILQLVNLKKVIPDYRPGGIAPSIIKIGVSGIFAVCVTWFLRQKCPAELDTVWMRIADLALTFMFYLATYSMAALLLRVSLFKKGYSILICFIGTRPWRVKRN